MAFRHLASCDLDQRSLIGYGIFRREPWHFLGIYATCREAESRAKEAGTDYEVLFGAYRERTDDFVPTGLLRDARPDPDHVPDPSHSMPVGNDAIARNDATKGI